MPPVVGYGVQGGVLVSSCPRLATESWKCPIHIHMANRQNIKHLIFNTERLIKDYPSLSSWIPGLLCTPHCWGHLVLVRLLHTSHTFGRNALIWGYFQNVWLRHFWGHWGQRTFDVEFWGWIKNDFLKMLADSSLDWGWFWQFFSPYCSWINPS